MLDLSKARDRMVDIHLARRGGWSSVILDGLTRLRALLPLAVPG